MVTYKHVNEVGRNICVKPQAKRMESRAILLLIATFVGALIILINEVFRNRCVTHQAKRMDSRAILFLIASFVWALIILIIKQTNTNVANQTNKLNK